jgi:hypothetical protein
MEGLRQRVAVIARDERQVLTLEPDHQTLLACTAVPGATLESLGLALEQLRGLTARERVRAVLALDQGFRLEDAAAVALAVPAGHDAAAFTRWLSRRLARETPVEIVHGPGDGLALAAAIRAREGFAPGRIRYARGPNGRIRLEAFEFHVAEHCNLRCANCCNMSPLVGRAFLSVAELEDLCRRVGDAIEADVLKIMGGEALDELTISHYSSAPVPPRVLAREQSARYGFVLNVKPVGEFSQVLSSRFDRDDEQVRRTYARCWLRHRCIVVRRGRFYMCTRAAYTHVGGNHVAGGEVDDVAGDEPVHRHLLGGPAAAGRRRWFGGSQPSCRPRRGFYAAAGGQTYWQSGRRRSLRRRVDFSSGDRESGRSRCRSNAPRPDSRRPRPRCGRR